jgi:superfamily II DNA/RNA helicase
MIDPILKLRHETKIMRISNSVRTQRIIFSEQFTERIEILAEKMLEEPYESILMEKMKTKKILTRKKTWRQMNEILRRRIRRKKTVQNN